MNHFSFEEKIDRELEKLREDKEKVRAICGEE